MNDVSSNPTSIQSAGPISVEARPGSGEPTTSQTPKVESIDFKGTITAPSTPPVVPVKSALDAVRQRLGKLTPPTPQDAIKAAKAATGELPTSPS